MKRFSFISGSAHRALGLACVVAFVALALYSSPNLIARIQIMKTAKAEDSLIGRLQRGFHSSLGDEGAMPDLDGAVGWLNSGPLSRKSLRGKVVLVNFWTFTCINSIRPLPYLRSWAVRPVVGSLSSPAQGTLFVWGQTWANLATRWRTCLGGR